ncbi:MAG: transposase [Elusimicrobiota bacterium]
MHVVARGNNKARIFLDVIDNSEFVRLLSLGISRYGAELHAYCLMPNHIHLLLRDALGRLSDMMEWTLGNYARKFNKRHGRVGHVFQGRYRAKLIIRTTHFYVAGRYIHMNPVRGGLCERPEDYPWSSMRAYLGLEEAGLLSRESLWAPYSDLGLGSVSAMYEFTTRTPYASDHAASAVPDGVAGNALRAAVVARPPGEMRVIEEVANLFDASAGALLERSRRRRLRIARSVAMLAVRDKIGMPLADIARIFGMKSQNGVSLAINRLRKRACADRCLVNRLTDLGLTTIG